MTPPSTPSALEALQVLMGHTDPKTTQRYRKFAVDNSRDVARLLAARREYELAQVA